MIKRSKRGLNRPALNYLTKVTRVYKIGHSPWEATNFPHMVDSKRDSTKALKTVNDRY